MNSFFFCLVRLYRNWVSFLFCFVLFSFSTEVELRADIKTRFFLHLVRSLFFALKMDDAQLTFFKEFQIWREAYTRIHFTPFAVLILMATLVALDLISDSLCSACFQQSGTHDCPTLALHRRKGNLTRFLYDENVAHYLFSRDSRPSSNASTCNVRNFDRWWTLRENQVWDVEASARFVRSKSNDENDSNVLV